MDSKKLNRRDFLRLSALAAAGLTLAACAPQATATQAPATSAPAAGATPTTAPQPAAKGNMAFWPEWGGKDADALKVQVDKWSAANGTTVDYLPIRDHARMIASISAGEPPDLLMTWDANAVGSWGFQDALKDFGPYITAAKMDLTNFLKIGLDSCNLMGIRQIGLPLTNYLTSVFWYNKDAFTKAGLDPNTPPATWDDVVAYSDKMTVYNNGQLTKLGYMVLTGQDAHPTLFAYANGGSIWSDDFRKVTPDSDADIAGLTWAQQFYKKYTSKEIARWTSSIANDESLPTAVLYTGDGAMQINGEWMPSMYELLSPVPSLGFGYLPYPAAKPEVKGTMTANTNPMVIPTAAKNPDAGFSFVEFISKAENSAPMCQIVGNASPIKDGLQLQIQGTKSPAYKDLLTQVWTQANVKTMTINSPIGAEYMDAYQKARDSIMNDLVDPLKTMQGVRDQMQPKLDDALKKLGL